jgi:hypothetical protein
MRVRRASPRLARRSRTARPARIATSRSSNPLTATVVGGGPPRSSARVQNADALDDIFVRDLQTSTTTLVSRATGATGAKGKRQ